MIDERLRPEPDEATPHRLRTAVESVLGNVFTEGNTVQVLRNGKEIFPAMLEAIRNAERSIDFVTFVYWKGSIATTFAEALSERARNGVRVRVVLDGFGSLPMKQATIEMMKGAGVIVERFRPVVRWKVWESDHRTHRKILVVDDEIGFTGGVGIADEWDGDAQDPSEWRDTHFRIEGPAVLGLRAAFLTDWRDTGHRIDEADIAVRRPDEGGDQAVGIVDGSAQIGVNDAQRILEALVAGAEERIIIQTPYFNPTDELIEALKAATRRRVQIDILVPGPHIDKRISEIVAKDSYVPLIDHGIRVWIYQPTMMHVKAVLVDGELALLGSVNINRRSVVKDEEVAMLVLDPALVSTLTEHFDEDVERSLPFSQTEDLSLVERALARVVRPIKNEM